MRAPDPVAGSQVNLLRISVILRVSLAQCFFKCSLGIPMGPLSLLSKSVICYCSMNQIGLIKPLKNSSIKNLNHYPTSRQDITACLNNESNI